MKWITAIIRGERLDDVREALIAAEITRITVSRCTGHGRALESGLYRGQEVVPNLISRVRIDIAVNDAFAKITIDTILKAARSGESGEVGDGKIFVTELQECIRISTGQRGGEAI
ncbi:MAG: transcriptional regulator [Gemmatimonadetes bacterium]|nr:transcriptional regulator [Gemmatimonadota bacterium]